MHPVKPPDKAPVAYQTWADRLFPACFGAFLGLALLKFGNPPIMEKWVNAPGDKYEFLISTPWPIAWAYWLLVLLIVLGFFTAKCAKTPLSSVQKRLLLLPLVWFGWQCLATANSVDPQLSKPTLLHFAACLVCFYLGAFALAPARNPLSFWIPLLAGFLLVLAVGWEQHFGGLEASRKYFQTYLSEESAHLPPEFIQKMKSTRIFSTLFYPNALAGAILLFLPPLIVAVSQWPEAWASKRVRLALVVAITPVGFFFYTFGGPAPAIFLLAVALTFLLPAWRLCLAAVLTLGALTCLLWSGSKGGWLLMLILIVIVFLRINIPKNVKLVLIFGLLIVGLAGFFWKYSAFFQKGATSVSARFDYWRSALQIVAKHPILGTGPGTFAIPYAQVKRPDAEMTRMVHNDYLEQATDSGIVGFLPYLLFVAVSLIKTFPCDGSREKPRSLQPCEDQNRTLSFATWLGIFGWALQCFVEFSLYIPSLSWGAFALLGFMVASQTRQNPSKSQNEP